MDAIPVESGSYLLHLTLERSTRLVIGRLGAFDFPAADYLYMGSAHGPGGLRARIRHHIRPAARLNWHIDWLRVHAVLYGGWLSTAAGKLECSWSQLLLSLPDAAVPAPGFGAADCQNRCPAHLLAFPVPLELAQVEAVIGSGNPVRFTV
jgi:Uri superfamily endonuclease